jgi:hypothetical protein
MMRSLVVGIRLPLPADENVTEGGREASWVQSKRPLANSLIACVP